MRICIISREYPPETGWGGIATFAKHLSHGLTDLGHEVEVISLALDQPRSIRESGILVHRVSPDDVGGGFNRAGMLMTYTKYVLQTNTALWKKFIEIHKKKPFDVVDTPELLAEGLWPALTKTAPLAVRLYTPHSKFIAERLHNVRPNVDHQLVAALERVAMLSADVLTSPSDDLADFVSLDLNYPREKIKIVRNPIDPDVFQPAGAKAIPSNGKALVLFVGRLEERKGIHYLIDAIPKVVANHPNVRFVIVGDDTNNGAGQKSVRNELLEKVNQHGVKDVIEWIPRVALDALPAHYRSADICVVPSVYDNSPYTCLEAMSCGKPVIGTSAGGTQEYIVNNESGIIVPPRDAYSLAEAITQLLQDKAKRLALGEAARQRVLAHFQRKEIARQTIAVYEEAIANFAKRADCKLYRRDETQLYGDVDQFLRAWDEGIYDLLFMEPAFRVVHYWRFLRARPKLFVGRAMALVIKKVFGPRSANWGFMQRLESEIKNKTADGAGLTARERAQESLVGQSK